MFATETEFTQRYLGADEARGVCQFDAAQNLEMAVLVERVWAAVVARAAQLLRSCCAGSPTLLWTTYLSTYLAH